MTAASAMHRALGNLLQNAQRCAGTSPVELQTALANGECRVCVLDQGSVSAADLIEAMFLPFTAKTLHAAL